MEKATWGIREIETDSFENYRQKHPEDQPLTTYKHILDNIRLVARLNMRNGTGIDRE